MKKPSINLLLIITAIIQFYVIYEYNKLFSSSAEMVTLAAETTVKSSKLLRYLEDKKDNTVFISNRNDFRIEVIRVINSLKEDQ